MAPSSEDSADDSTALDEQQSLLEDSLELVVSVYDGAVREGVDQPVVMLLDCEDSIGGQIARGWLGSDAVDEAIADQRSEDPSGETTTVFARDFPLAECAKQVHAFIRNLLSERLAAKRLISSHEKRKPLMEV